MQPAPQTLTESVEQHRQRASRSRGSYKAVLRRISRYTELTDIEPWSETKQERVKQDARQRIQDGVGDLVENELLIAESYFHQSLGKALTRSGKAVIIAFVHSPENYYPSLMASRGSAFSDETKAEIARRYGVLEGKSLIASGCAQINVSVVKNRKRFQLG